MEHQETMGLDKKEDQGCCIADVKKIGGHSTEKDMKLVQDAADLIISCLNINQVGAKTGILALAGVLMSTLLTHFCGEDIRKFINDSLDSYIKREETDEL